MTDLAERILAAVEMRLQLADEHHLGRCAVFRDFPYAKPCDCTGPSEVRNDCAADREIVDLYVKVRDSNVDLERRRMWSDHERKDWEHMHEVLPYLTAVVTALARGYGIQP